MINSTDDILKGQYRRRKGRDVFQTTEEKRFQKETVRFLSQYVTV